MKIGINEVLVHDHFGGAQQRELSVLPELLQQIADHGWQSIVYVSRDIESTLLEALTSGAPCEIVRTPLPAIPTYKRLLLGIPYWRQQVKKDKLSLFHTAYYPAPHLDIPTVLTAHDVRFMHMPGTYTPWRLRFLKKIVPYTFRRVSRIITVSEDTKNDLCNFWGLDGQNIDISHNAITHQYALITDKDQLKRVRNKYNLPSQYILCVSHIEPRKNLHRLLKAYLQLCSQTNFPHYLVIMGKPIFGFQSLFKEVQESAFSNRILFTGFVDDEDMASVYSLADVLTFPSLHEGFGMPAIEAMACGVPVITSSVSALPEICGDAAIFVDPYDEHSILDGMLQVLGCNEKREELIEKGYGQSKKFSCGNSAAAVIESYKKALG